jgi:dihydrofolate synthase/folylpolyglutamate synthase
VNSRIEGAIARLHALHPRLIDLSLERLEVLLAKLGHPERQLPPVIHVAGTNGKGSTCAFLRAIGEAAGMRVHVYISPHLIRFNERIRLAGELISDKALAAVLEEVESVNDGAAITVFEVITAAAFVAFARTPAELCVLEVGLGGRGDATNVVANPAACAITSISLDHQEFLGSTLEAIAGEKAAIMKRSAPVVTGEQDAVVWQTLAAASARTGSRLLSRDADWRIVRSGERLHYIDPHGELDLPAPSLLGEFQVDNAGIAIATLRATGLGVVNEAFRRGVAAAEWPARLQRLDGTLAALLPAGWQLWLDGGHNPGAGAALGRHLACWSDQPLHLVVGMKQSKDAAEFLRPLLPRAASIWAVAEPTQHQAMPVEALIAASCGKARPGRTVAATLAAIATDASARQGRVLICGSLYLAGEVLKADASGPLSA